MCGTLHMWCVCMWFMACVVCVCSGIYVWCVYLYVVWCVKCVWGVCSKVCVYDMVCGVSVWHGRHYMFLCGMCGMVCICGIYYVYGVRVCVVWCMWHVVCTMCVCGMVYVVRGVYDVCGRQETEAEAGELTGFSAAALGADSDLRAAHGGPSTLKQWLHCPHSRAGTLGPSKAGHLHSAASAQGPTFRPSGPARTQ